MRFIDRSFGDLFQMMWTRVLWHWQVEESGDKRLFYL